jgi:hypothetical protein
VSYSTELERPAEKEKSFILLQVSIHISLYFVTSTMAICAHRDGSLLSRPCLTLPDSHLYEDGQNSISARFLE